MILYAVKTLIAATVVVAAAEVAKRNAMLGALIMSLPVGTILGMCFMYADTKDSANIAAFVRALPVALIPSVLFCYAFAFLVESNVGFVMAMGLAIAIMLAGYGVYMLFVSRT